MPMPPRIDYLFTTFPLLSETFYQREVRALRRAGVELRIFSLWGGEPDFEGLPVQRFNKWLLPSLIWWIPYWCLSQPATARSVFTRLLGSLPPSGLNLLETLLGLGFGLIHARQLAMNRSSNDLLHAAWATAPGTAAQLIGALTKRPFSQGAHAYDVFRDGGDWWLESKLRDAAAVITSTQATHDALLDRGAQASSLYLIRRGLESVPPLPNPRRDRSTIRLLSVGRLIEKKGYFAQIEIYRALRDAGMTFEARIVGDGPLLGDINKAIARLDLSNHVTLLGALPYDQTRSQYDWADLFLFTGLVASSGDRDGLPNVVPEAMAAGLPVLASPVGGVPEAIEDGSTGFLIESKDTAIWLDRIRQLAMDEDSYCGIRKQAYEWAIREFSADDNAQRLVRAWQAAVADARWTT